MKHFLQHISDLVLISKPWARYARRHPSTFVKNARNECPLSLGTDLFAVGVLFTLSLMSFTFAAPRGYSEIEFVPDEEWNLGYFVQWLEFKHKSLCFTADYVSGRMMKTDVTFESGGLVTLRTTNRGKGAERWLTHLQGKKHIKPVE